MADVDAAPARSAGESGADVLPLANIVFLHIPKTAGQSVHHFLKKLVGGAAVAPARVNTQLYGMSVPEIRKYRVHSGHLDWTMLDCVRDPKFVFTVLREPVDRILSFYFFLRSEAQTLSEADLRLPENEGKHAALHLSCDDYFGGGRPHLRNFLDNHYDNFYVYYFAGRTYDGRQRLRARQAADKSFTSEKIVEMALANLATLDGVYTIDRLDLLERDLRRIKGVFGTDVKLPSLRVNRGKDRSADRMEKLRELGATEATFARIRDMVAEDQKIWNIYSARPAADGG